jgi:hypothetical protein
MSNFLLRDPDCVLIHIPKTAGTSIRKGAWHGRYEGPVHGHLPLEWQHYFRFAFVRHPLDRFISVWKMFTEGTHNEPGWTMPKDAHPLPLADFAEIVFDDSIVFDERRRSFPEKIRHHAMPQTHPFYCLRQAEFVGRYERLASDFAVVAQRVGLNAPLPHMHSTQHGAWSEYLSGSLLERCRTFYRDDFQELGY